MPLYALLAAILGATFAEASSEGVVNFDGEIISSGCDIAPGSESQSVDMGEVSAQSFAGIGSTLGSAEFQIELISCHSSLTSVGVIFDGPPNSTDPSILALQGSSSAEGLGIALYEADGVTPVPLRVAGGFLVLNGGSGGVLRYVAKYKSVSDVVTAGAANAVVNFTLEYN